jgi:uncharacterized membrane protein YcaP (DUF421 family)
MHSLGQTLQSLLGLDRELAQVSAGQMALRTLMVYVVALAIVRLGSRRFLSQASAFDVIVAIMLGSVMSRAINGSAPFGPTLVSGAVLVGLHWLIATAAYRLDWLGPIVKGRPVRLIVDGAVDQEAMRRSGVGDKDLEQALRTEAGVTDPSAVRAATLERDGSISVVKSDRPPRIIDVSVADGVQTVRVKLE